MTEALYRCTKCTTRFLVYGAQQPVYCPVCGDVPTEDTGGDTRRDDLDGLTALEYECDGCERVFTAYTDAGIGPEMSFEAANCPYCNRDPGTPDIVGPAP